MKADSHHLSMDSYFRMSEERRLGSCLLDPDEERTGSVSLLQGAFHRQICVLPVDAHERRRKERLAKQEAERVLRWKMAEKLRKSS